MIQVVEPVNIFEREAFEAEVEKAKSPRAKADTIANRTKKTITEKMEEDPFFYRKLSALLQQAIDDYKAERISEAEYLARVTDTMEEVRGGNVKDVPEALQANDFSRALFGELKTQINTQPVNDAATDDGVVREDGPAYGADLPPRKPAADEVLAEAAFGLKLAKGEAQEVALRGAYLHVTTPKGSEIEIKEALEAWYRRHAQEQFEKR